MRNTQQRHKASKDVQTKASRDQIQEYLARELMSRFDQYRPTHVPREHRLSVQEAESSGATTPPLVQSHGEEVGCDVGYTDPVQESRETQTECVSFNSAAVYAVLSGGLSLYADTREAWCYVSAYTEQHDTVLEFVHEKFGIDGTAAVDRLQYLLNYCQYNNDVIGRNTEQIGYLSAKCAGLYETVLVREKQIQLLETESKRCAELLRELPFFPHLDLQNSNASLEEIRNELAYQSIAQKAERERSSAMAAQFQAENDKLLFRLEQCNAVLQSTQNDANVAREAANSARKKAAMLFYQFRRIWAGLGHDPEQFRPAQIQGIETAILELKSNNLALYDAQQQLAELCKKQQVRLGDLKRLYADALTQREAAAQEVELERYQKCYLTVDCYMQQRITQQAQEELTLARKRIEDLGHSLNECRQRELNLRQQLQSHAKSTLTQENTDALIYCYSELKLAYYTINRLKEQNEQLVKQIAPDYSSVVVYKSYTRIAGVQTDTQSYYALDSNSLANQCATLYQALKLMQEQFTSAEKHISQQKTEISAVRRESEVLCRAIAAFLGAEPNYHAILAFVESQNSNLADLQHKTLVLEYDLESAEQSNLQLKSNLCEAERYYAESANYLKARDADVSRLYELCYELYVKFATVERESAYFPVYYQQISDMQAANADLHAKLIEAQQCVEDLRARHQAYLEINEGIRRAFDKAQAQPPDIKLNLDDTRLHSADEAQESAVFGVMTRLQERYELVSERCKQLEIAEKRQETRVEELEQANSKLVAELRETAARYEKALLQHAQADERMRSAETRLEHEMNYKRIDADTWDRDYSDKRAALAKLAADNEAARAREHALQAQLSQRQYQLSDAMQTAEKAQADAYMCQYARTELEQQLADARRTIQQKEALCFQTKQQYMEKDRVDQINKYRITELDKTIGMLEYRVKQAYACEYEQRCTIERLQMQLQTATTNESACRRMLSDAETKLGEVSYYEHHIADLLDKLKALTIENERYKRAFY